MNTKRVGLVALALLSAGPAFANACNGSAVDIVGALQLGLMALTLVGACGLVLVGCVVIGATCAVPNRVRAATLGLSLCAGLCGAALAANSTDATSIRGLFVLFVATTIAAAVAALRQLHHRPSHALSSTSN